MAAGLAATAIDMRKEKIREAMQTFESFGTPNGASS